MIPLLFEEDIQKFEQLSKSEIKELIKILLKYLDDTDVQNLIHEIQDDSEAAGMLKLAEATFADWDNEEDSYYDSCDL